MTNFTKGQEVTLVKMWNHEGQAYATNAIVHSCGAKVLRLIVDGHLHGTHFDASTMVAPMEVGQQPDFTRVVDGHGKFNAALELATWNLNHTKNLNAMNEEAGREIRHTEYKPTVRPY